jgi:low temperature requirement protein LtrA
MVQMVGVLVLAIGLPRMFASIEHHASHLDNSVMVLGYVVMRVALVFQWLRAAKQNSPRRRACLTYVFAVSLAQLGWVSQIFIDASVTTFVVITFVLIAVELAGPYFAEKHDGGTPWHAHHIAERYSLFAIIALGEGIVGTLATLSAIIDAQGWTLDTALVCVAGTGLTFGIWWVYYMLPSAAVLQEHRDRSFVWGYTQMLVVTSIVATGAGLHVAAYFIEHKTHIGSYETLLTVAIPVAIFLALLYALYAYLVREFDPLHIWLLLGTAAVVALAIVAAHNGVDMAVCLTILMLAPMVTIVGYETLGHRHQAEALARGR